MGVEPILVDTRSKVHVTVPDVTLPSTLPILEVYPASTYLVYLLSNVGCVPFSQLFERIS
jgi:hypothetical protein